MKDGKPSKLSQKTFAILVKIIIFFYGKKEVIGKEKLPGSDTIIVANHCQMNGPIVGEVFMPDNTYIWCAGQMMNFSEVSSYAFEDFWSQKPWWQRPFFRLLSYLIAPLAVCLFNNARTIPVYRDSRIIRTFKQTIKRLDEGKNILIFPEKDEKRNNIIYAFWQNYVEIAKIYYKKTGKKLNFTSLYIAPKLGRAYVGNTTTFDPDADFESEKERINSFLAQDITSVGVSLPKHIVVPYRNMAKKYYVTNKDEGALPGEKKRS